MLKTHQMRALLALADNGSIRGAARELNLSQSAVTKSMRELEEQMGASLFVRTTQRTELTPAGRALLEHVRLIMATMRRAEEEVRRLSGQTVARARIAVTPLLAVRRLSRILTEFEKLHPVGQLDVDIGTIGNIVEQLLDGRLDLALGIARPENLPADLQFQPLGKVELIPVSGQDGFKDRVMTWEALAAERWLINPSPGSADQIALDWLSSIGIELVQPPHLCRSPFIMSALNRQSALVSLCPRQIAEDPLWGKGLYPIKVTPLPPSVPLGILTRRHDPVSLVTRDIINVVTRCCRSL